MTDRSANVTQGASASVLDVIRGRRSIPKLRPDPVPRDLIAQLLDAAVWSPNHRLTEPWQFFVLEGESKRQFAGMRRDFRQAQLPNPDAPEVGAALEKVYQSTIDTPVIIVVTSATANDPEMREEDVWATYGAAYAFMLGAWSQGLGTYLRTGAFREYAPLRQMLGLPDTRRIIGMIYAGYPAEVPQRRRTKASEKTVWLD